MERSKTGKKSHLSLPNQNTIVINIKCYYFMTQRKIAMKFNLQKKNRLEQSKNDTSSYPVPRGLYSPKQWMSYLTNLTIYLYFIHCPLVVTHTSNLIIKKTTGIKSISDHYYQSLYQPEHFKDVLKN